ncbi:AlpA family transcriptional regulator [uncultured Aliiroseovarius sp.]|uniref:helix-turn-helix transcriptional regulator n=1 Tax=uncultured Aliiroseovarius sp. TaxID=1658783 RepID=UPI00260D2C5A|nr:AlpA family phage regulatory protein [uncultured Aliiroseovarius sp.]
MQNQSTYKSAKEILAQYPMSRTTLYRLIQKGDFPPPVKFGSRSYWKRDEVDNAVKAIEDKRFS